MSLHPDYPVVEGEYRLNAEWTITLDQPVNRRIEDGDMVLWRPGATVWLTIWHNDGGMSIEQRVNDVERRMSADATELEQHDVGPVRYFSYRLAENADDERVAALYGYVFSASSHVQIAAYFDDEADADGAAAVYRSLRYTG